MVDQGLLKDGDRSRHPQRHVVTRAVGAEPDLEVDDTAVPLVPGDRILLCSDGLTAGLADQTIANLMHLDAPPREICAELVRACIEAGAPDNVSVICVFASEG